MEFENLNIDLSDHHYIENKSMPNRCGEIIISDNPPIIAFSLICLYCEKKIQTFDDFKNHFLNEHYNLNENHLNSKLLKETNYSFRKPIKRKIKNDDDNNSNEFDFVNSMNNKDNTTIKNFIESKFYNNQIIKETISYDTSSNTSTELEPEIQIERYDDDVDDVDDDDDDDNDNENSNDKMFITNEKLYSHSENDTEISGSITWTYDDSDNTIGSQKLDTDSLNSSINKRNLNKIKFISSTSRKDKLINQQEKTIEIYKEKYIPEKPKFVLAAVNLPTKTNLSINDELNDDILVDMRSDSEAYPLHNEPIINNSNKIDFIDKECKPKFKFNNIKFRRQHNEKYYLSIEKTYNDNDGLFYCPECSKRYKRIESLRYHHLSHTGVPAPFQCSICNKGFPSAYKVRIHFTKHTGERPFRCHICPRVYRHKQQLKHHLESHVIDSKEKLLNINNKSSEEILC